MGRSWCGQPGGWWDHSPPPSPEKANEIWEGCGWQSLSFRFSPPHLTSLNCAGELDPGEVGNAELLVASFSRICAVFHGMDRCSMLIHPTCDTGTWTLLPNCRSHGLRDFKGLGFLHEHQKDMASTPPMTEWGGLSANQSFMYVLLISFPWVVIYVGRNKPGQEILVCALCTDSRRCFLMDSVFLHSRTVVKNSPASWIIYKPLVYTSLFRAGCWTENYKFAQPEEDGFVTIRAAVPRACFCVHKGKWLSYFKEKVMRKKKDLIILYQVLRQEWDRKKLIGMFSFHRGMEASLVS